MIKSFDEYKYYLEQDRLASGIPDGVKKPRFGRDEIWRWERLMRKLEYITNCKRGGIWNIYKLFLKFRYKQTSQKLGFTIPINTFEEGLWIPHYGTIVVNGRAKIGKNCRIMENTNIGDNGGGVPGIGNNCFICTGAKILGAVKIGDNVIVGANSVVVKSFVQDDVTLGGVPAKIISQKNSKRFLDKRVV